MDGSSPSDQSGMRFVVGPKTAPLVKKRRSFVKSSSTVVGGDKKSTSASRATHEGEDAQCGGITIENLKSRISGTFFVWGDVPEVQRQHGSPSSSPFVAPSPSESLLHSSGTNHRQGDI